MQFNLAMPQPRGGDIPETFDEIKISLASPERIIAWSEGEIKKPETINYRTFKPERDGLFCAKIFGPVRDFECLCGKYKRVKFRGITCEKCGVEVTLQKVRRERMGHIVLAAPVAHIWFLKLLPSKIGALLDMKLKDLESVLYFERFVVTDPGVEVLLNGEPLEEKQLLSEGILRDLKDKYGEESFSASIGAEAIRELLSNLDLEFEREVLREDLLSSNSNQRKTDIKKRLKIVEHFIESGNKPEWMVLTVLPVIPPELRPLVPLDGGRFATSDLNDLYRRVINRNNRLSRLIELRAPELIIRNEKRMLQEAVDALFDNGRRGKVITNTSNKRPLKSLSDMLKGKQGRFRQNLLGKRVDFSGRSVIVTGPELKLHQCGLPKKMAKELFKPFIFSKLQERGLSANVKQSKKLVENDAEVIWGVLDDVIREHPVLLNRAPTLHRLGIQAFEPIMIEGKAIQLHPLVCSAFNADFDGDQMAVHVPLSLEAQLEARVLMMSTNNVLSPANGMPIIVPSQDMVLGLYYTSLKRAGMTGEGMLFSSPEEVELALASGHVHKHAEVTARVKELNSAGDVAYTRYVTTPGRLLLGSHLPLNANVSFAILNRELRKKEIQEVIDTVYRYCGQKESVIFCDHIMEIGFKEACNAGISFCKNDMMVPDDKRRIVEKTREKVAELNEHYRRGFSDEKELNRKTIDEWEACTNQIQSKMEGGIEAKQFFEGVEQERNSIYMMTDSGARGSKDQMKQLAGMRGLITKGTGEIIGTPIISNFKEGLNVAEYFIAANGSRKSLADTAMKTASAGYLTRRLVDVAQDCIVREHDCHAGLDSSALEMEEERGIRVEPTIRDGNVVVNLADRIAGRVLAEDVAHARTSEIIAHKDELLTEARARDIEAAEIQSVLIRSPLTCKSEDGVCSLCYGLDLARGTLVNTGEAVGIIAAQSIGEPGTQLTMRSFHTGGISQKIDEQSFILAPYDGVVRFENSKLLIDSNGQAIVVGQSMRLVVEKPDGAPARPPYKVPYGSILRVTENQPVSSNDVLFELDPVTIRRYAEQSGLVRAIDLIDGETTEKRKIEEFGITEEVVINTGGGKKPDRLKPKNQRSARADKQGHVWFDGAVLQDNGDDGPVVTSRNMHLTIVNDQGQDEFVHFVPENSVLKVKNGDYVMSKAELFALDPIATFSRSTEHMGRVQFNEKEVRNVRRTEKIVASKNFHLTIVSDEDQVVADHLVPVNSVLQVRNGDFVDGNSKLFVPETITCTAAQKGRVRFNDRDTRINADNDLVASSEGMRMVIVNDQDQDQVVAVHLVPENSVLKVKNGEYVASQAELFALEPKASFAPLSSQKGHVQFDGESVHANSDNEWIVSSRHLPLTIVDDRDQVVAVHFAPVNSVLKVRNGDLVESDRELFSLDSATPSSKSTDSKGRVQFDDKGVQEDVLYTGVIVKSDNLYMTVINDQGQAVAVHFAPKNSNLRVRNGDSVTSLTELFFLGSKAWTDVPQQTWGGDNKILKPALLLVDKFSGQPIQLDSGREAYYELPRGATMRRTGVEASKQGLEVAVGDVLFSQLKGFRTREITGGLPRVADLFEARNPKDPAVLAEISGTVRFEREYSATRVISIEPDDSTSDQVVKYKIPKGLPLEVHDGDQVERGDSIVDGTPSPQDVLRSKGLGELARHMIEGVQDVYQMQGIKISDKHIEVIVRQMLKKCRITDPGDTVLVVDEVVDKAELKAINAAAAGRNEKEAKAVPVVLGITKAALGTNSFISAASFQETTKVLTDAAIRGRVDKLSGLKENVIVGRLIPAGTGSATAEIRRLAYEEDERLALLEKDSDLSGLFIDFPETDFDTEELDGDSLPALPGTENEAGEPDADSMPVVP